MTLVLSGCGTDDDSPSGKESDMTPDEAYAALEKVSLDLLNEVAQPGTIEKGEQGRPVPCGGPGGNERNKIKFSYSATASAADPATVMESARTTLTGRGLEVAGPDSTAVGDQLSFSGDAFTAGLTLRKNGLLEAGGETACLDDPDQ
ncbi:hypothetical protein ASD66_20470 [Nocardioides sp. Root151]|nr:hypothetical protein ASD30_07235 [Nocardioides sp. Root140]KQZ67330.1 hypothetical protein ASD66_20470 [Nocardioides sp. Root151]KRF12592.1 hypothetical protein ASH02_13590 [Nocardioides sp. Soil796]